MFHLGKKRLLLISFVFKKLIRTFRQDLQQALPEFTEHLYDKYTESGGSFSLATYVKRDASYAGSYAA